MPTDNTRAEAIEAAKELWPGTKFTRNGEAFTAPPVREGGVSERLIAHTVDVAIHLLLARIRALADDFRDGRNGYGDNEAYEKCARDLANLCNQIEGARDE